MICRNWSFSLETRTQQDFLFRSSSPGSISSLPSWRVLKPAKMSMLVNCGGCRTSLVLPPGAQSIQCAICRHVTPIAYGRAAPALTAPQISNPYGNASQHPQYTPTVCFSLPRWFQFHSCILIWVVLVCGRSFHFVKRNSGFAELFLDSIALCLIISATCVHSLQMHMARKRLSCVVSITSSLVTS